MCVPWGTPVCSVSTRLDYLPYSSCCCDLHEVVSPLSNGVASCVASQHAPHRILYRNKWGFSPKKNTRFWSCFCFCFCPLGMVFTRTHMLGIVLACVLAGVVSGLQTRHDTGAQEMCRRGLPMYAHMWDAPCSAIASPPNTLLPPLPCNGSSSHHVSSVPALRKGGHTVMSLQRARRGAPLVSTTLSVLTTFPIFYAVCMNKTTA